MKSSFVLYIDYIEQVQLLDDQQAGVLLRAILYYAAGKELPEMDGMTSMAFSFIRGRMDRDAAEYEKTLEARRTAGLMGGRPRKHEKQEAPDAKKANGFSEKQEKAKKANGFSEKQTKAKKPDNVPVPDNVPDKDINTICPEAGKPAPVSKTAVAFVLNDGSMYNVAENDVEKFQQLYPGIDVMQELRNITGWCDSNPKNRKTRAGAKRFVNGWLSRAQNRAPTQKQGATQARAGKNHFHNFDERSYDYDQAVLGEIIAGQQKGG